jgi:uncharacterized cupin superfamily protein
VYIVSVVDETLIVNLTDARARRHPKRATQLQLEPEGARWPDTGVNVQIMQPGQPNCRYHSEPVQEDFLVLSGDCIAIIEGEEIPLRQWDFVHCPAGVPHVFVGAGEGPCAVLMIGSRREDAAHYPVSELAARYDASTLSETDDPSEAYADWRSTPWESATSQWPPAAQCAAEKRLRPSPGPGRSGIPIQPFSTGTPTRLPHSVQEPS